METQLKSEVINYGNEREEIGYQKGYLRATLDARKRRKHKNQLLRRLSDKYYDYLDDVIAARKKR